MSSKDLTPKQAAFAREYLVDLNATQAAIRAGYSPKGAEVTGSQLLRNPKVAAALQKAMDKRAAKTEITADDVLRSIKRIRDTAEGQGEMQHALKANELLGKHLKLFTEKHEHEHHGDLNIQVVFGDD